MKVEEGLYLVKILGVWSIKMGITPLYQPFQKGDLVIGPDGNTTGYAGPIYELKLPEGADIEGAKAPFKWLGYRTKIDQPQGVLLVFGDLPSEEIRGQRESGVEVALIKERGEVIPCPWR
jgi:hypothetical protein